MSDLIGKSLGPYQVLLKVRASPLTVIYKAYDTRQGKNVALEVILPGRVRPVMLFYKLKDHAELLQELYHPNISQLLECDEWDGELCMVYDFCPRGILRRRFNQKMSYIEAAEKLVPVAQALTYAHQKGVVHGSICPQNILLNQDGIPTLFDFGVEQIIAKELMMQTPGYWLGNRISGYTAPEQAQGKGSTPVSDLYSLSVVYYELITGRRPFNADTTLDEVIASCYKDLPEADKTLKELPETIQKILDKSLARDPDKRFTNSQHFTNLLAKIALKQPITAEMLTNPNWQPRPRSRLPLWAGLALLGVVLAAGITGKLIWRTGGLQVSATPSLPAVAGIAGTPTRIVTAPATLTPRPTNTLEPTATQAAETTIEPQATLVPVVRQQSLPVFIHTPMPSHQVIDTTNAGRILNLARWGIGSLTDTAWSPDGSQFAIATSIGVFLLDGESLEVEHILDTTGWVNSIAYSRDGRLLATGEKSGLVRVWEIETGQEISTLGGHLLPVNDVAFSPDASQLVSGSDDHTVRVWNVEKHQVIWVSDMHVKEVEGVDFSPDGQKVISGGLDFTLKIWDAASGALQLNINNPAVVYEVAYAPDGKLIYTGCGNQTIRSWDAATGQPVETMAGIATLISSMAISRDGKWVAAGDVRGKVYIWDQEARLVGSFTNERLLPLLSTNFFYTNQVAFLPDSKRLSSGIWDNTIILWNVETAAEEKKFYALSEYAQEAVFSPNSRYLAIQSVDNQVKLWDAGANQAMYSLPGMLVQGKIFSYDSKYLAVKLNATTLRIVEVETGETFYEFGGHQTIDSISFSPDGKMLTSGVDRDLHLWSLVSGQEIITLKNFGYEGCAVTSGTFSSALTFGTRFGLVDFVQGGNTSLCRLVKVGWMNELVYQRDGDVIAAGGTSKIEVWDVNNEKNTKKDLEGLMGFQTDQLVVAPSGEWVAAALDDFSIRVWSAESGKEMMRLTGHDSRITALAVSPDGRLIVSTALDGTIRIWGVQ